MRHRSTAAVVTLTTMLGACLWLAPSSVASTATVVKQCAQGRGASYRLKPSDQAFLKTYLQCVLSADGLHAHPKDTIDLYGKAVGSGGAGGYSTVPVSFPKYIAPTVAGFVRAPRSDENWNYINKKIEEAYYRTEAQPIPGFYTVYGDTTPPSPTLTQLAGSFAPARTTIDKGAGGHQRPLAIDVVVQRGSWFHDGPGANLRYMVLIKAV